MRGHNMPPTRPKLKAKFVTGPDGCPEAIERNGLKHYRIELSLDGVDSESTRLVTYDLDPSYVDPKREVTSSTPAFAQRITSYGDYPITATVLGRGGQNWTVQNLSDALEETYGPDRPAVIVAALKDIKEN
jgi:hypothetical protein